jgi:hypothetical protein
MFSLPRVLPFFAIVLLPFTVFAQTNTNGTNANAIPTAVPFLTIAPDSRSGAMGDAGVALSPDVNANYWNPSKLAFIEDNNSIAASYSPWLANLAPDISLSYLSYAHKVDERNSIGLSLRYFNLGAVNQTGSDAQSLGTFTPAEFSIDGSFARKFGENFSLGLTLRYIHSNLSDGSAATPSEGEGNAVAADVSAFYKNPTANGLFAAGLDISNIGSKISYSTGGPTQFLPTNLRVGAADTWNLDEYNQFTLALDLNKLLVPTEDNSTASVPEGIFQSFSDAPGGASEEFKEIYYSLGAEYWYNQAFALRAGYYYQNASKGGSQYLTLGAGVKYQEFNLDFSYIAASQQSSPLANTLRFTLIYNFGIVKQ